MSNFKIEEELTNSIARDCKGKPINEVLFTVVSWQGRNFLYTGKFIEEDWQGSLRIAECVNGDYKDRYGNLKGWLKFVLKRTNKRLDKVLELQHNLNQESKQLCNLRESLWEVL